MNVITKTVSLPDGRTISIETGKLAKQADGAVMLRMNNTVLLATVCGAKDAVPGTDFMPLQVEYREKYSAAGRFPGGFTKREGKANDDEILTCRLVDRALRPLFPKDYRNDVAIVATVMSVEQDNSPEIAAMNGAAIAVAISDIPFDGPCATTQGGMVDGEVRVNRHVIGKGKRHRKPMLYKHEIKMLREYIYRFHGTNPDQNAYLFYSKCKGKYEKCSTRSVNKQLDIYVAQLKQKHSDFPSHVHSHQFRHSMATHLIDDGINVFNVSKILGHKSVETTMKYIGITPKMTEKAIAQIESSSLHHISAKWKKTPSLVDLIK